MSRQDTVKPVRCAGWYELKSGGLRLYLHSKYGNGLQSAHYATSWAEASDVAVCHQVLVEDVAPEMRTTFAARTLAMGILISARRKS